MIVEPRIEEYQRRLAEARDEPVLLEMEAYAAELGFPIIDRLCGINVELLARSIGGRRVFELGSGFGYSAYWFARAVGEAGHVWLTDGDASNETRARDYLTRAGLWDRVTYLVGDALTRFAETDGEFDVVYCDVDKEGYPACWQAARSRVRVGGLYICDNVLWSARVLEEDPDAETQAILEQNDAIASDPDFLSTILPTRDGMVVALRLR